MLLKALGCLAMATGLVSAQSSTSSSKREATTHIVKVGVEGHSFMPDEITAEVGDTIRYHFYPKDHSVARAAYGVPCQPIEYTEPGHVPSFWSGFKIVDFPKTDGPFFDVKVNDTEPIWYYCSQKKACAPDHMVGVVWVNGTDLKEQQSNMTLQAQKDKAINAKAQYSPGDPYNSEGGSSADSNKKEGLSKGAIAGIAVGAVAGVVLIASLVYLFGRNKSLSETLRYSRPPPGKIAPLPAMSEGPNSPYPPSFPASPAPGYGGETKSANAMVAPTPGYNQHDNNFNAHQSWMSQTPTMRAQSPDSMAEHGYNNGGMMSPNAFSPHNSYMPQQQQQQQQQQPQPYHLQSSPTETPWSPGGYNWQNMQPQHEMGAGQEGIVQQRQSGMNNGYPTQSHVAAPVELAGETSENAVSAAPPVYRSALNESGEPVQKPQDKTPAVTTRDF